MKLVKLGGSVITYKGSRPRYRRKVMEGLAAELAPFRDELCIVHGGGSFGHPLAYRFGLHRGIDRRKQLMGFAEVHASMRDLNTRVLKALRSEAIPAVSVSPPLLVKMVGGKVASFRGQSLLDHLEAGLVPVTFGDVVLDEAQGSAIVSGDELMYQLARLVRPEIAVFVADVGGVKDANGSVIPSISSPLPELEDVEEGIDVTGGLGGKVDAMLRIAREGPRCLLLSGLVEGRLGRALQGGTVPCTEVRVAPNAPQSQPRPPPKDSK